jgi:hypothetical protein
MNIDKINKKNKKLMDKVMKMYNINTEVRYNWIKHYKNPAIDYLNKATIYHSDNINFKTYIVNIIKIKLKEIKYRVIFIIRFIEKTFNKIKEKINNFFKLFKLRG